MGAKANRRRARKKRQLARQAAEQSAFEMRTEEMILDDPESEYDEWLEHHGLEQHGG